MYKIQTYVAQLVEARELVEEGAVRHTLFQWQGVHKLMQVFREQRRLAKFLHKKKQFIWI